MNTTIKNIGLAGAGLLIGGLMVYTTSFSNGQTITVSDDGIRPVSEQKVLIKTTETKVITTTDFDGTLSDIKNEILPKLYAQRDSINAEIAKYEALAEQVDTEVKKLPKRGEK